jgi:hypothetical protein
MFGTNGLASSFVAMQFNSDGLINVSVPAAGVTALSTASGALAINAWQHFAIILNGSSSKIFKNGVNVASGTITMPTSSNNAASIGYDTTPTVNFNYHGYVDELRITKGVACYSGDFVTQDAAFANINEGTGFAEPDWPAALGNTVIDGAATWTNMGALVQPLMQGPLIAA